MQTRKQFLFNALSAASAMALLGSKGAGNRRAPSSGLSFDLHSHPGRLFASSDSGFGPAPNPITTLKEMKESRLTGAFCTLVADSKILAPGPTGISITRKHEPGEAWEEYKKQLADVKSLLVRAGISEATRATDLNYTKSLAAYLAVEGGDFLEGKVERLDGVYQDGVRSIQLVHYVPNDLGDLQTAASLHGGLSSFGKEVVKKMNRLGMLIDVAHATYQTTKDVADLTDSPIMLSHSILEMEPDRPIAKRSITKEHALVVAKTGGVIGVWPSGFNKSFDEFVDNTLRLVDVVGIDHVGIGTDMDGNFKPVLSSYKQYPTFAEALRSKGLSNTEIGKIMGKNAAILLKKVLN